MIFLTVGTQLPFDRLVRILDELAPSLREEIVAQIGRGGYTPLNFVSHNSLSKQEFTDQLQKARVVVAHAGIGTILSAQKYRKPLILMPRRAIHREHRNDHQLATCKQLASRKGIKIAESKEEILEYLTADRLEPFEPIDVSRREEFLENLACIIRKGVLGQATSVKSAALPDEPHSNEN